MLKWLSFGQANAHTMAALYATQPYYEEHSLSINLHFSHIKSMSYRLLRRVHFLWNKGCISLPGHLFFKFLPHSFQVLFICV